AFKSKVRRGRSTGQLGNVDYDPINPERIIRVIHESCRSGPRKQGLFVRGNRTIVPAPGSDAVTVKSRVVIKDLAIEDHRPHVDQLGSASHAVTSDQLIKRIDSAILVVIGGISDGGRIEIGMWVTSRRRFIGERDGKQP